MKNSELEAYNKRLRADIARLEAQLREASPQWYRDRVNELDSQFSKQLQDLNAKIFERDRQLRKLREGIQELQKLL